MLARIRRRRALVSLGHKPFCSRCGFRAPCFSRARANAAGSDMPVSPPVRGRGGVPRRGHRPGRPQSRHECDEAGQRHDGQCDRQRRGEVGHLRPGHRAAVGQRGPPRSPRVPAVVFATTPSWISAHGPMSVAVRPPGGPSLRPAARLRVPVTHAAVGYSFARMAAYVHQDSEQPDRVGRAVRRRLQSGCRELAFTQRATGP